MKKLASMPVLLILLVYLTILSASAGVSAVLYAPAHRDGIYEYEMISPDAEQWKGDSQIIKRNVLNNESEVIYQGDLWPAMYANSKYIVVPLDQKFLRLNKKTYEAVYVPMSCQRNNLCYMPFFINEKFFVYKNNVDVYLVELDTLGTKAIKDVFSGDGMYGGYANDILEELYIDGDTLLIQTGPMAYEFLKGVGATIEYNIKTNDLIRHDKLVVPIHKIKGSDKVWYYELNEDDSISLIVADNNLENKAVIHTAKFVVGSGYTGSVAHHLYSDENNIYYSIIDFGDTYDSEMTTKIVRASIDGREKEFIFDDMYMQYETVYGNKIIIPDKIPYLVTYFDNDLTAETHEKIKNDIVLKIGSPDAIIAGAYHAIDAGNMFVQPLVKNDKTLLPIRFIAEQLNAEVDWDGENQIVTLKKEGTIITTKIGENIIRVNGETRTLECAGIVLNDRTMLPIRDVAETFGLEVFWEDGLIILTGERARVFPEGMINELKNQFWSFNEKSVTYVSY